MIKIKLALDAGHGENTYRETGSKGVPQMAEHDFNATVVKYAKELAELNGFEVLLTQPLFGRDVPLKQRTDLANKEKADFLISFHADANANKGAHGHWVFYWHTSTKGKKFAEIWDKYANQIMKNNCRGIQQSKPNHWTNFHMVRETSMPSVLIEHDFMTSAIGIKNLLSDDYRRRCAETAIRAACEYFGKTFVEKGDKVEEFVDSEYEYNKVYKERIYLKNGKLSHAKDSDYSIPATDVRFIKFKTGKTKFRFVYETNAKNSKLLEKYDADFSCNAPYFYEGKILGDTEINDNLISNAYGKMLKWHEFAVVDGVPTFGQIDKLKRQDFLFQFSPLLVENGKSVFEKYIKIEEVNSDIVNSRCQRTFSWTDKAGDLWIAVADGRTKYDQGLTLLEATLFALEKGAWMCGNWDGGGSSILCKKGNGGINQKLNTGKNERTVHHALLFYINEDIPKERLNPTQQVSIPKIQREVNVIVNGKKMSNGLLINNLTFVPLRELGEALGAIIGWDSASKQASFNGIPVTSEDSYLINNLTYIKLRKFSELAGCKVDWNAETYTAKIKK